MSLFRRFGWPNGIWRRTGSSGISLVSVRWSGIADWPDRAVVGLNACEVCPVQEGVCQIGTAQVSVSEYRVAQVRSFQVGKFQVGK